MDRLTTDDGCVAVREGTAFERIWLDETSWVDVARGWLAGADQLHDLLAEATAWRQGRLGRYERWIEEPRLGAWWRVGEEPAHPVLLEAHRALRSRYRLQADGVALARYRDGRDGVAFHRDRELRWLDDTVIGVLTLGQSRSFLLRPRAKRYDHHSPNGGATHDLAPVSGDLLVMGGRCQADWEHSVPKIGRPIGERISLQWRHTSRRGRPEQGANHSAPRNFSRR
ncbi:alpha-ketoglutarate-dependent dioxygenase AlkB [soil metagenome]